MPEKVTTNVISGGIFIVIAAFFLVQALQLPLGTPFRMGPGFMPATLAILLAMLGVTVLISGLRQTESVEKLSLPWRGMTMILISLAIFGFFFSELGLVPLVFLCTFLFSLASAQNSIRDALVIATVMTLISFLTFKIGLGISLPTFGSWFI